MAKVILVLCDGLRNDTAEQQMGYLEHLVERGQAQRAVVTAELPTKSRPLYATILTGVSASQHGITHNQLVRRLDHSNVFSAARDAQKVTAASAFYWFSEVYNQAPFDPIWDREVDDPDRPIQHGRFYCTNEYPDPEVFATAAMLAEKFHPDFLLIHPLGIDHQGHQFGSDSVQYRNQVLLQDEQLAMFTPDWIQQGYTLLVTADHGMTPDQTHGGTLASVRQVPLYVLGSEQNSFHLKTHVSQCQIAPTICQWLGVEIPSSMQHPSLLGSLVDT